MHGLPNLKIYQLCLTVISKAPKVTPTQRGWITSRLICKFTTLKELSRADVYMYIIGQVVKFREFGSKFRTLNSVGQNNLGLYPGKKEARDNSVSIATCYGMDGPEIESRWGARFSAPVHSGPGAHPASCTMGTGSIHWRNLVVRMYICTS